jgi:hypothetical protein
MNRQDHAHSKQGNVATRLSPRRSDGIRIATPVTVARNRRPLSASKLPD